MTEQFKPGPDELMIIKQQNISDGFATSIFFRVCSTLMIHVDGDGKCTIMGQHVGTNTAVRDVLKSIVDWGGKAHVDTMSPGQITLGSTSQKIILKEGRIEDADGKSLTPQEAYVALCKILGVSHLAVYQCSTEY